MYWKDVKYNTCILNSSSHWEDMGSTAKADPSTWVKNMTFENITVEGMTNCAIRVFALSSTENIHVKNLKIDAWSQLDAASQVSLLKRYTNSAGQKVTLGNETRDSRGLKLENYTVGGTAINKSGTNWAADKLGRLGFDAETWDNWNAWGPGGNNPDPVTGGKIVNGATSKCVDRAGAGTANGTAIQQWSCATTPYLDARRPAAQVRRQVPGRRRRPHRQRDQGPPVGLRRLGQPGVGLPGRWHPEEPQVRPLPRHREPEHGRRRPPAPVGLQRLGQPEMDSHQLTGPGARRPHGRRPARPPARTVAGPARPAADPPLTHPDERATLWKQGTQRRLSACSASWSACCSSATGPQPSSTSWAGPTARRPRQGSGPAGGRRSSS